MFACAMHVESCMIILKQEAFHQQTHISCQLQKKA